MFILNTYTWLSLYYHLDMIFVKYCWIWHIKLPGLWTHSSHCTHLTFQSNQITVCTWVFPGWINTLHTMHARTQSDEALTASQDTMQPYEAAWGGWGEDGYSFLWSKRKKGEGKGEEDMSGKQPIRSSAQPLTTNIFWMLYKIPGTVLNMGGQQEVGWRSWPLGSSYFSTV